MNCYVKISWRRLWWILVLILCSILIIFPHHVLLRAVPKYGQGVVLDEQTLRKIRYIPQYHCLRYRKLDLIKRCRNSLYNDITKKFRKSHILVNNSMEAEVANIGNTGGVW